MEEATGDLRQLHERSLPKAVPDEFVRAVFATMRDCPQHTFQILTKRSDRLREIGGSLPWRSNMWMGVSVEDASAKHRITDLVAFPAKVRFLSCEPLIGSLEQLPLENIDWVIVGGESGPGSRPMQRSWVEAIRMQCSTHNVAFFFKQWGGVRKHTTGRELDGRTYDELPLVQVAI